MKKNILLGLVLICMPSLCISQVFQSTYGANGYDFGYSVKQTSDGSYIVAGATSSFCKTAQAYLLRIDVNGNILWTNNYGSSNIEHAYDVIESNDGGFVFAGYTNQNWGFGYDSYIGKISSSGEAQWLKTFGGTDWDFAYSVKQTADGGYIFAGQTYSYGNGGDAWVVKINSSGNALWDKRFGGPGEDYFRCVFEMNDGGFIFAGSTKSVLAGGQFDAWLVRTSSNGTLIWNKTYDKSGHDDIGNSVVQTNDGNVVFCGVTNNGTNNDIWILKASDNNSGLILWDYSSAGSGDDVGYSITKSALNSNVVAAGKTNSIGAGDYDFIYYELTSTGSLMGAGTYGSANSEICQSIASCSDGGYILAGLTPYPFLDDVLIVRISSNGNTSPTVAHYFDPTLCRILYMKDTPADNGIEPNPTTAPIWNSEDIWVRNTQDFFPFPNQHIHQNPEYSPTIPNYVYVKVRNISNDESSGLEELHLYWAKASTALSWPNPWTGGVYYDPGNTMLMGDLIGTKTIPVIQPGGSVIIEFPWYPKNPNLYSSVFGLEKSHFCLLARITNSQSPPYGMAYTENSNLGGNVINNNNIIWKNVSVVDLLLGKNFTGYVTIGNFTKEVSSAKIEFGKKRKFDDMFSNFGSISIVIDDSFGRILNKSKLKIKGLKRIEKNVFLLTSSAASIEGIKLAPNEFHTIGINFEWNKSSRPKNNKEYYFDIVQSENSKIVGGQTFNIKQKKKK